MKTAKKTAIISTSLADGVITFTVRGGAPDGTDAQLQLDTMACSPAVRERAMVHGLIQRISDAAALSRNTTTGQAASPAEKLAEMERLRDHYATGTEEWGISRAASGGNEGGLLVQCLVRAYPNKSVESLRTWAKARSASERAGLLAGPMLKPHADAIRAEAAKGVDDEALLDELDGE